FLQLTLTITLLSLIWVAADFAEAPFAAWIRDARRTAANFRGYRLTLLVFLKARIGIVCLGSCCLDRFDMAEKPRPRGNSPAKSSEMERSAGTAFLEKCVTNALDSAKSYRPS